MRTENPNHPAPARETPKCRGFSVLVVDDSAIVRERLCSLLAEVDCVSQVIEAASGAAAWALFEQLVPHAVLLEIQLPDGSGLDLLSRIKQRSSSCLVIVLTNLRDPVFRAESHRRGADYFLHKSSEFERVTTLLQSFAG